jgi:hypothetical protein
MGIWIAVLVLGICTLGSFYMTILAAKDGDSGGAWLFASFGLFFGTLLLVFAMKAISKRKAFFKTIDEGISGKPEPQTGFVPHWFMMAAIFLVILVIVVSILMKLIR